MCYPEFQKRCLDVLIISQDSVNDHKVWDEVEISRMVPGGAPFPMLADRDGDVARLYEAYDEKRGVSARAQFLIDPGGIIMASQFIIPQVGPSIPQIIRVLEGCQYHEATGDSIPTNWVPGKPTIKPDIRLAGHIWQVWRPEKEC